MTQSTEATNNENTTEGVKTLFIIRHAKSSWDISSLSDFERPLNERGKKDAPMMAKRLIDQKIAIDAFVSSPAKRAKKTAELFHETFGEKAGDIIFVSKLYHANPGDFYDTVCQLDDSFNSVAIFSHNPGITAFVNELTDTVKVDNMPTCGVFAVQVQSNKWANFMKAKKKFLFFDYPKSS